MKIAIRSTLEVDIPSHLTDDELITALPSLAGDERRVTSRLVAHLVEMERRQLYLPAGYSSLFNYCREALGYTEDAAYTRTVAVRVAHRFPVVLDMLGDGRLGLTTLKLLAPLLSESNCDALLADAAGGSKRDVEKLIARVSPKPDVPSSVRKLPAGSSPAFAGPESATRSAAANESGPASGSDEKGTVPERNDDPPAAAPATRPEVKPLAPERYRVQFTIGEETERKMRRLQTLLKREIPDGDPAVLFDRGLDLLLAAVEGRKLGRTKERQVKERRPGHPRSRHVPARTRRVVSARDEERCAFLGRDGRRCTERAFLEYHHGPIPFGHGGPPTPANVALHCRAHNAYEGRRVFGPYLPPEVREARILYDAMRFTVPERK